MNGIDRLGAVLGPVILGIFLKLSASMSNIIHMFAIPPVVGAIVVVLAIKVDMRGKSLEESPKLLIELPETPPITPKSRFPLHHKQRVSKEPQSPRRASPVR